MMRGHFSGGKFSLGVMVRGAIFLLGNYPPGLLSLGQLSGGKSSRGQLPEEQLSGGWGQFSLGGSCVDTISFPQSPIK